MQAIGLRDQHFDKRPTASQSIAMDKSAASDSSPLNSADLGLLEMSGLTNGCDSGVHLLDIREDEAEAYRERTLDPFSFQHQQPELFTSSKVSKNVLKVVCHKIWQK